MELGWGRKDPESGPVFTVNGILTSLEDALDFAEALSDKMGGINIHILFIPTLGFFNDVHDAFSLLLHRDDGEISAFIRNELSRFNGSKLVICHSRGVLNVRNALEGAAAELQNGVHVVAIAPAGYIKEGTSAQAVHYQVPWYRDFVHLLDYFGYRRERTHVAELDSHPNAPLFDHSFDSPTYEEQIARAIQTFVGGNDAIIHRSIE
jgi:hypothetical protein